MLRTMLLALIQRNQSRRTVATGTFGLGPALIQQSLRRMQVTTNAAIGYLLSIGKLIFGDCE
jgi:hypothetical protein